MNQEDLSFSFDLASVDRTDLLTKTARQLDSGRSTLAHGDTGIKPTPEGETIRSLNKDVAEFAGFPTVYKITDKDFLKAKLNVPITFSKLATKFNFYWMYFPVVLFPQHNWAFNKLEMEVRFAAIKSKPHLQPSAYQILPEQKFQTLVEVDTFLEMRVNENFEFEAKIPSVDLQAGEFKGGIGGGVDVKAAGGMGTVFGPFRYYAKRAKIQHTATGAERVFWRLEGAEFFQDDAPQIVVIAKVPKGIKNISVDATLQAHRYFNFASAGLQSSAKNLPDVMRDFLMGGVPIGKSSTWNLKDVL